MPQVFLSVFTFCGLILLCVAVPSELEEDKVNCTVIGVATTCCETHGCAFFNCTDGMRCEDARSITALGSTCVTAVNTCLEILATSRDSGNIIDSTHNTTTLPPVTSFPDNTTNSTLTPVTITASSHPDNSTGNISSTTSEPVTGKTSVTPNGTETTATQDVTTTLTTVKSSTETETITTPYATSPVTPDDKPCEHNFDVASFLGGMALMFVILSATFLSCKYYKSRVVQRYQQF